MLQHATVLLSWTYLVYGLLPPASPSLSVLMQSKTWTLTSLRSLRKEVLKQLCQRYGQLIVASAKMRGKSTSCTDNKNKKAGRESTLVIVHETQSDDCAERLSSKWNETSTQTDTHTHRQTAHPHMTKLHVRLF